MLRKTHKILAKHNRIHKNTFGVKNRTHNPHEVQVANYATLMTSAVRSECKTSYVQHEDLKTKLQMNQYVHVHVRELETL